MSNIISDIATLLKAGLTIADIKELAKVDSAEKPAEVPAPKADEKQPKEDATDYKALYEQTQKDLKDLQEQNTRDDITPEPLQIDEIIKSVKSHIC